MMLVIARGLALLTAIGTAVPVATGAMRDPDFVAPDLLLAAALAVAAFWPGRWASPALIAANAYGLGVFSVALARQAGAGAISPLLVGAILACVAGLVLAALKRSPPPLS